MLEALLAALPVLALAIPLLFGRYIGEEKLASLRARVAPTLRRAPRSLRARHNPFIPFRNGGRLIAARLAGRAPPAPSLA